MFPRQHGFVLISGNTAVNESDYIPNLIECVSKWAVTISMMNAVMGKGEGHIETPKEGSDLHVGSGRANGEKESSRPGGVSLLPSVSSRLTFLRWYINPFKAYI